MNAYIQGHNFLIFRERASPAEMGAMLDAVYHVYRELFQGRTMRTYRRDYGFRVRDTMPQHMTPGYGQISCRIFRNGIHFHGRMAERVKEDFVKQMGLVGESEPMASSARPQERPAEQLEFFEPELPLKNAA